MTTQHYDKAFYEAQSGGSYDSARIVLALLREVLPFASVCDVGCGAGTWVKALLELGVEDVLGLDGAYAQPSLQIPERHFLAADLCAPLAVGRRFDLAMSLEVAEHLPRERSAGFVEDLTRLAPAVLFSAAVPCQGGTDHINERWQDFWAEAFARHGFACHDIIRPRIWNAPGVEVWYRQNTLLFLHRDHPHAEAVRAAAAGLTAPVAVVHPEMFPLGFNMDNKALLLKFLYWSFARDLRRLLGGRGGAAPRRAP